MPTVFRRGPYWFYFYSNDASTPTMRTSRYTCMWNGTEM